MITVRPAKQQDLAIIKKLESGFDFKLAQSFLSCCLAEDEKGVIAVGQLIPFAEVLMMASKERSKAERVTALQALMREAMFQAKKLNLAQLHGFVKFEDNEKLANILKKHWGFKDCEGKPLVLDL